LNNKNVPKIAMSRPDLTNAERQAVPNSALMNEEQVEFVCRVIHAEPGKSK
jgi:hypothetical protein